MLSANSYAILNKKIQRVRVKEIFSESKVRQRYERNKK